MEKTGCKIICGAPTTLAVDDDDFADYVDYVMCSAVSVFSSKIVLL